jgi:hypothetical protein
LRWMISSSADQLHSPDTLEAILPADLIGRDNRTRAYPAAREMVILDDHLEARPGRICLPAGGPIAARRSAQ